MEHYKKIQRFNVGIGHMTISAVCIAFLGVFAKLGMSFSDLSLFVFLRFFIPLVLSLFVLIPIGTLKRAFKNELLPSYIIRGLAATASQYFLFYCLTRVQLFNAMMLWNTAPVFIPLVTWALYKHHISKATWISVALGMLGVICVLKPDVGIIDWFSIWGVLAGLCTAISQSLYGSNANKAPIDVNIFFVFLVGSVVSVVGLIFFHLILKNDFFLIIKPVFENGVKPYLFIFCIALSSIGNQYFKGKAYQHARPGVLSPFFYLAVLFSGIFGWILFNHIPDFLAIMGMILIVFSSVIRMSFAPKTEQT